jgi:hypothetical protein
MGKSLWEEFKDSRVVRAVLVVVAGYFSVVAFLYILRNFISPMGYTPKAIILIIFLFIFFEWIIDMLVPKRRKKW